MEGRAVDLGIPVAARTTGDAIFAWCVQHAEEIGLQEIIWNRRIWSARRPTVRPYLVSPHTDHVHIGLCWQGALGLTSWFRTPQAPAGGDRQVDLEGIARYVQQRRNRRKTMNTILYGGYNHIFWVNSKGELWHKYAEREPKPDPARGVFPDGRENMSVRYNVREPLDAGAGVVLDVLPSNVLQVTVGTRTGDVMLLRFAPSSGWGSEAVRSR